MPGVTFIQPDGTRRSLAADIGQSVMQVAIENGLDGIIAECGGELVCATCHVRIVSADALPGPSSAEDEMLDFTSEPRTATSRLSCQIRMTDALDGLVVQLPDTQV